MNSHTVNLKMNKHIKSKHLVIRRLVIVEHISLKRLKHIFICFKIIVPLKRTISLSISADIMR